VTCQARAVYTCDTVGDASSAFVFASAGRYFAVATRAAIEVVVLPPLMPVPRAPAHMRGLAVMRGMVVPVIDIGLLLGASEPPSIPRRAVVLRDDTLCAAIAVQRVLGESALETPLEKDEPSEYLMGSFQAFDRAIEFIDAPRFLKALAQR
jgi:chemotaxis signal transduction protein